MNNLHFVLVNADNAKKAIAAVLEGITCWNSPPIVEECRVISAFSEDGTDDIISKSYYKASEALVSLLDKYASAGETKFSKATAYIRDIINEPISFELSPRSQYPSVRSALDKLIAMLQDFDPEQDSSNDIVGFAYNLMDISGYVDGRKALKAGVDVPEFWDRQLHKLGLTDLTKQSKGKKRYIVVLDVFAESDGVSSGYYHECA